MAPAEPQERACDLILWLHGDLLLDVCWYVDMEVRYRSRRLFASWSAQLTSARWVRACGRLPTNLSACTSYSSLSTPTSLRKLTSRSKSSSASRCQFRGQTSTR